MAQDTRNGQRTIEEAIRDGLLVDVSETAKRAGVRYSTFMSPTTLAKKNSKGPNELHDSLQMLGNAYKFLHGYDLYDTVDAGDETCILEPNEKYGHIILVLDTDKLGELNLKRTTSDEGEYQM